jgi:predicted nuclease of restriction endonuclease-like (RecB) superfamily
MLDVEGEDFFIDLLLYHRQLKSLVAIELKVIDFKPEYAGQMQFVPIPRDSDCPFHFHKCF